MDEEDLKSQPLLTLNKKLCFKEKGSILKAYMHTIKKDSEISQGYFKPRSNIKPKNKRGIFRKMVFKTYMQLSLPIAIQQVTEYRVIETNILGAITKIRKELLSVNRHNVIPFWYLNNVNGLYKTLIKSSQR